MVVAGMDACLLLPLALAAGACARTQAFPVVCVVLAALVIALALPPPDLGMPSLLPYDATSARAADMVPNPRLEKNKPGEEEASSQEKDDTRWVAVRRRDAPRLQSSAQRASMRARLARDFGLVASE